MRLRLSQGDVTGRREESGVRGLLRLYYRREGDHSGPQDGGLIGGDEDQVAEAVRLRRTFVLAAAIGY